MQKVVGGLVLGAMLTSAAAVNAAGCDNDAGRAAFHVRALQSELMVAALACGTRDSYNEFVIKFKKPLSDFGGALRNQFKSDYGPAAERELNSYITALANRQSERSVQGRDAFCANAARTFQALASVQTKTLASFSMDRPAGDVDVPSTCRQTVELVGTPR